jgi:hypothetical protein
VPVPACRIADISKLWTFLVYCRGSAFPVSLDGSYRSNAVQSRAFPYSYKLSDVAIKTGFSGSTVSRVLHDKTRKYKISEETRTAVRRAAEELGYAPNKLARGLRLKKTHQIVADVQIPSLPRW